MLGFSPLFLAFVGVPIIEIYLFLLVGGRIGTLNTMIVIILTAAIGTQLVRQQGMIVLRRAQESMNAGRLPANEMVDGVLILAAGLLLLTPGFFTDAVGFLLLIPPTRAIMRRYVLARIQDRITLHAASRGPRASEMEIVDDSPARVDPIEPKKLDDGGEV